MKTLYELKNTEGLEIQGEVIKGVYNGTIRWPGFGGSVVFGANENGIMEHVSVSCFDRRRLPTWEDMATLKDIFFFPDEMVIQIHPPEERYFHGIGRTQNCLHLWRPRNGDWSILNSPDLWD